MILDRSFRVELREPISQVQDGPSVLTSRRMVVISTNSHESTPFRSDRPARALHAGADREDCAHIVCDSLVLDGVVRSASFQS